MYSLFAGAQYWFNRFENGNLELSDLPRFGRPVELDVKLLKQFIEEDPWLTLGCLAGHLGCSHAAVEKHLNNLSKIWRYGVLIPHELSRHQL